MRRPCPGPASRTRVTVSATGTAQPVTTRSTASRSRGARSARSVTRTASVGLNGRSGRPVVVRQVPGEETDGLPMGTPAVLPLAPARHGLAAWHVGCGHAREAPTDPGECSADSRT